MLKTNNNVKPGDKLLLTKPLGTGILTTALKNEHFTEDEISDAIESMLLLNRDPARLLVKYNANAVTDVTGFGLLGHLLEMLSGNGLGASIKVKDIPVFEKAFPLAENALHIPGGTLANLNYVEPSVINNDTAVWYYNILADPQTSGGLLISMPGSEVEGFRTELKEYPFEIAEIGEIHTENDKITLV